MGSPKFYDNNIVTPQWLSASPIAPFATDHGDIAILGAPGDFTLMHRRAWSHMRGHPEVPLIGMVDDYVVWLAVAMGLKAVSTTR